MLAVFGAGVDFGSVGAHFLSSNSATMGNCVKKDVKLEIKTLIRIYRTLTGSLCRSIVLGSVVSLAPSLAGKCSSARKGKKIQ